MRTYGRISLRYSWRASRRRNGASDRSTRETISWGPSDKPRVEAKVNKYLVRTIQPNYRQSMASRKEEWRLKEASHLPWRPQTSEGLQIQETTMTIQIDLYTATPENHQCWLKTKSSKLSRTTSARTRENMPWLNWRLWNSKCNCKTKTWGYWHSRTSWWLIYIERKRAAISHTKPSCDVRIELCKISRSCALRRTWRGPPGSFNWRSPPSRSRTSQSLLSRF